MGSILIIDNHACVNHTATVLVNIMSPYSNSNHLACSSTVSIVQ